MTSVKDVRVAVAPTARRLGRGSFVFTDDYSVFDWGKMPDPIPHKGASLCTMGAYNFELLEDVDIPTHYRGVVDDGDVVGLDAASTPANEMAIDLTQVPDLPYVDGAYDYEAYHEAGDENYLVPLEIVFRNTVPVGSSLRRRTEPTDWAFGFDEWPDRDVDLDEPIIEFSTKYEEQDRYLSREEAAAIAGTADIDRLADAARRVNAVVTDRATEAGFTHQDGKIECLYLDGEIRVADVVGTFDENRFSYDGQQVSKEVLRQYYKRTSPDWVEAVSAAKAEATRKGVADWRSLCAVDPPGLPDDVIEAASHLYAAGTNAYTGRDWFDVPSIDAAVDRVCEL